MSRGTDHRRRQARWRRRVRAFDGYWEGPGWRRAAAGQNEVLCPAASRLLVGGRRAGGLPGAGGPAGDGQRASGRIRGGGRKFADALYRAVRLPDDPVVDGRLRRDRYVVRVRGAGDGGAYEGASIERRGRRLELEVLPRERQGLSQRRLDSREISRGEAVVGLGGGPGVRLGAGEIGLLGGLGRAGVRLGVGVVCLALLVDERRDRDCGKNADDEDHDQKLDEGEPLLTSSAMTKTLQHFVVTP